jgi:hypothetical protein
MEIRHEREPLVEDGLAVVFKTQSGLIYTMAACMHIGAKGDSTSTKGEEMCLPRVAADQGLTDQPLASTTDTTASEAINHQTVAIITALIMICQ